MVKPDIPCPHCQGSGQVKLASVYAETLTLLRRQRREINGLELAKLAGCKNAAMCNRLVRLEQLGLVAGRRDGRERLWRAVNKDKNK